MICKSCSDAGRLNTEAQELEGELRRQKLLEVEALHKLCANFTGSDGNPREIPDESWCDCHHRTGSGHINRDSDGNAVRSIN